MSCPRFRALAAVTVAATMAFAAPALAHQGNPNFRSNITSIGPDGSGLSAQMLDYDDSIELHDTGKRTIVINGYNGEPYARIESNGTVQQNQRSPAVYLNAERLGGGAVPKSADPNAPPEWQTIDKTGRFVWHDHRSHWMSTALPPQVKNKSKPAFIFDWKVPVSIDGKPAAIRGNLFWHGEDNGGPPLAAIGGLLALALAGAAFVVLVRRRRGAGGVSDDDLGDAGGAEAW
jgi:hypothetical protein